MAAAQKKEIERKMREMRNHLWPGIKDDALWNRQDRDGYITIPRPLPLIMQIMDDMSKGKPVSSTYMELWCRSWDLLGFVVLNKHEELAFHSGCRGQRALSTWRERLRILRNLGFIDIKPGSSGEFSYALLWNPYHVIKKHYQEKHLALTDEVYNALKQRAIDIKADDLE